MPCTTSSPQVSALPIRCSRPSSTTSSSSREPRAGRRRTVSRDPARLHAVPPPAHWPPAADSAGHMAGTPQSCHMVRSFGRSPVACRQEYYRRDCTLNLRARVDNAIRFGATSSSSAALRMIGAAVQQPARGALRRTMSIKSIFGLVEKAKGVVDAAVNAPCR